MENTGLDNKLEGTTPEVHIAEAIVKPASNAASSSMSLIEKLKAAQASYTAPTEETISVTVKDIKGTKDENRVMLVTAEMGNIFAWKNTFDGGVPIGAPQFKAEITLRGATTEKGEYVNIVRVKYNLEATGKYSFVATQKLSVSL